MTRTRSICGRTSPVRSRCATTLERQRKREAVTDESIRAILGVPMVVDDVCIATLIVSRSAPLSDAERRNLERTAVVVALPGLLVRAAVEAEE